MSSCYNGPPKPSRLIPVNSDNLTHSTVQPKEDQGDHEKTNAVDSTSGMYTQCIC